MTNALNPFRFEDLNDKPEPESWGPVYNINRKRGQSVRDAVRAKQISELRSADAGKCRVNIAADLKYKFSAAKHRARLKAEFTAQANADKRSWADNKANHNGLTITQAYCDAMFAKRKRLAIEAAVKPRKPHYILRNGEFKLAA